MRIILVSILTGVGLVFALMVIAYVRFVLVHPGAAFDTSVFTHCWEYGLFAFVIGVYVGWRFSHA